MKLPKIKLSLNSTLDNTIFYNETDDIGFARNQINQIDIRIKSKQENNLKPWERYINNNIYSSLNKKNRLVINEKKKKIKCNKLSFNWNNQNIFNKTEIENIKASEQIKRQIKTKSDIKYKYKEPFMTASSFIETRHEIFLANKMINILKTEKNNIRKKQESYENSLKYENKLLDKDIDKFNEFTTSFKKKAQEEDLLLLNVIIDNKNLVDLYKKQLQEYNSTIYEVYKYIKLINNLKHYASFIHKLLGGDNDILHCDLIENITFKEFKSYDVYSVTQDIIKKAKNILYSTNSNDDINLNDSNTFNNFNLSFKTMEEKLVKIFTEKQRHISEKNEIIRKGSLEEEEKQKKFDNLQEGYKIQIEELDNKMKDYNKVFLTPEEKERIEFDYELLVDIYSTLFNNFQGLKEIKAENAYEMSRQIVTPIRNEIFKKEEKINNLIKVLEEYEKENNIIFNKVLTRRKLENRTLKLFREKELIKIRDNLRINKYNNKIKKIIIKGRYKYNFPNTPESTKYNLRKVNMTEMDINDLNMLYYQ